MSFLNKLWDETLAGPLPDSGLGKLRKYNSFSASQSPPMTISNDEGASMTIRPRSISIPIPTLSRTISGGDQNSFPDSSIGSTTPRTPSATPPETPGGDDARRFRRRKSADCYRQRPLESAERSSPTVYDWIVITALDR